MSSGRKLYLLNKITWTKINSCNWFDRIFRRNWLDLLLSFLSTYLNFGMCHKRFCSLAAQVGNQLVARDRGV